LSAKESLVFAAEIATDSGRTPRSDSAWILA
jgi:hypothetical protein